MAGLVAALAVAIFGFGMPAPAALAAAGYGALFGLLPIGWIVLAAVFLFHLTVRSASSKWSSARWPRSRPTGGCRRC